MERSDKRKFDASHIAAAQQRTILRLAAEQVRLNEQLKLVQQQLSENSYETSDRQQHIINASLELLKKGGLTNVTLREIASNLHMKAPALYWHFRSKEDLIDYMAEAILKKEFTDLIPKSVTQTWQDWLREQMKRLRHAMLIYPDGARVVAGAHLYPAVTLATLMEAGLVSLHSEGISLGTAHQIMMTATNYTFGYAIEEQAAPTPEQMTDIDINTVIRLYPLIAKVITDADHSAASKDKGFMTGLNYIIDGASKDLT